MILLDYNAIAIGNVAVQRLAADEGLIRHMILNSIRMYRQKFHKEYGEMVIVADGMNNWRKEAFPQYKAARRKKRDESTIDWNEVFRIINMVREEIQANFPYKVMHEDGCEADDVIAQLALETQEFGKYEPVMIVSADGDFKQLQVHKNVKQFSPLLKKFVVEPNPRTYLAEHILKGDTGDGVPNVLSDDNVFVDGRRQGILSAKKKAALLDDPRALGDEIYRNYQRNQQLIDLTNCPESVKESIINNFEQQDPWGNRPKVFPYLVQKRCKLLIECVGEFI
jgi:hypothetical protein|tara:strand:+ start:4178 stop:5020 length:843 start_codon:yes stop_codon:yes gene_type:complete